MYDKLKSLGVPIKTIKKAINRIEDENSSEDLFPERIHSDDEIKKIIIIRKLLKNKSLKTIESDFKNEKEFFINYYNNLFNKGASEFPGILEIYSLLKTKRAKPNVGNGYFFKMAPEDAKLYGKDIVKYFLSKNSDMFPISNRAKISLDSYFELLKLSKVDALYISKMKDFYYKKYKL